MMSRLSRIIIEGSQALPKGRGYMNLRKTYESCLRFYTTESEAIIKDVKPFESIPSPTRWPVLGHLHLFFPPMGPYRIERLYDAYARIHHQYGPVVRVDLGGEKILLFDPEDIKKMYQKEPKYPARPSFDILKIYRSRRRDLYNSGGVVIENGEEWYRLRQAVQWMLQPGSAAPYLALHEQIAEDFVKRLRDRSYREGCLGLQDLLNELYRYTQEAIGVLCFGKRLGVLVPYDSSETEKETEDSKVVQAVNDTLEAMATTFLGPSWILKFFKTKAYKKLEKAQEIIYHIATSNMKEAEEQLKKIESSNSEQESKVPQYQFLKKLLADESLDAKDRNILMLEMFFAGIDATGNALAFFLYNIAKNPRVQQDLYEEIRSTIPDFKINDVSVFEKLPYLRAAMKESHRLTPTSGGSARILDSDAVFSGYHVPKGSLCIGVHPTIGQSESFCKRPKQFSPDRWLRRSNGVLVRPHPYAVLPFGHGSRRCVGQRFAEQEMMVCIIKILQNFRVEVNVQEEMYTKMRLQLTPEGKMHFYFHRRD